MVLNMLIVGSNPKRLSVFDSLPSSLSLLSPHPPLLCPFCPCYNLNQEPLISCLTHLQLYIYTLEPILKVVCIYLCHNILNILVIAKLDIQLIYMFLTFEKSLVQVAIVTPFNFPLEIPVLQLMGALYMGNKPILKVDSKVYSHKCIGRLNLIISRF